jgi:hypothetical protein
MMETGMLWFDNDPKSTIQGKIALAAKYYAGKYGRVPDTCYVNPGSLSDGPLQVGPIRVRAWRSVMPGHLWIGVEEKAGKNASL